MQAPIVIVEHGDILIFQSVESAQVFLEPIDVKNGEYVAYDREGRVLRLGVSRKVRRSFIGTETTTESVVITDDEKPVDQSSALRRELLNFFNNTESYCQEDELVPLHELIDKAVQRYGYAG